MSGTIKISKEYFRKHLVEKLESIDEKLCEVDTLLYENEAMHTAWQKIRDANLELEELIDALKI